MVGENPVGSSCATSSGEVPVDLRLDEIPFCYREISDAEGVVGVVIGPVKNEVLNLLGRIGCDGKCETCPVFRTVEFGERFTDTLVEAIVVKVGWMGRMAIRFQEIVSCE